MAHLLRNRDLNVDRQKNVLKPLTAGGKHKNIQANTAQDPLKKDEPKAKRPALQDITKVLSDVEISSVKRHSKNTKKTEKLVLNAEYLEFDPAPNVDFDKENKNDPYAVSEYARDIFKYYKKREKNFEVNSYYTKFQIRRNQNGALNPMTRATLVDWLVEIQEAFEMNHETLYMAIKLMDMFFQRCEAVDKNVLQLVAAAAIFVSAKMEERAPPLISDLIHMSHDAFTKNQVIKMEQDLLRTVRYNLCYPLSYTFLRRYARVVHIDMKMLTLARYILELSLHSLELCCEPESKLAGAALLLAMRMKKAGDWNEVLMKYSEYKVNDLDSLVWRLNHLLHTFNEDFPHVTMVKSKYNHPVFFEVGKTKLLPDRLHFLY